MSEVSFEDTMQLVFPTSLRERQMTHHQELPSAALPEARGMCAMVRCGEYWPTMMVDVYTNVAKCTGCARNRLDARRHTSTLKLFPADEPLANLATDVCEPFLDSEYGNKRILHTVDRPSKLTRAILIKDITAMGVASAFIDVSKAPSGLPDSTVTDIGPQVASILFQGALGLKGIVTKYTTPYDPQTNGQIWRHDRTIMTQPRVYAAEQPMSGIVMSHSSLRLVVPACTLAMSKPLMFVSPRRLQNIGVERLPELRPLTEKEELEEGGELDSHAVAMQYVEDLRDNLSGTQAPDQGAKGLQTDL